jgi:hypothetical protein
VGTLTAGAIGTGFTPIPNSALANSGLTINGTAVSLGGSATIAAAAATLTGSTLAAGVTESSLTSVGTLTNLTVTNPISGSVTGNAGTVTNGVVTTGSYSDPAWITALAGSKITGGIGGNAATATALQVARTINGVSFDGTANITVPAAAGTLTGNTLASGVTASSLTSVGTLANLTVTNPISGSVTGSSGSTTGNASTATALQTARNINGVSFNGTADITVAAAASTLTGNTLASGVTASSLTSVGTLTSLTVSGALTVDTNTLVVDAANNRVGILNATPGSTLHVGSTVASGGLADSTFRLNVSSASNTFFAVQDATVQCYFGAVGTFATPEMRIGTYTNHPLRMIVNNSQQWSFLSGGSFVCTGSTPRIGIGNALPDYSLHIGTTAPPVALGQVMVTGTASNVGVSVTNGTVQGYLLTDLGGSLLFGSFSSHDLVVRTNNTNRWSIGASTGHFLAGTDNTYDIGASGATRPRDLYLGRNMVGGGWVRAGSVSAGAASTTTFGSTTSTTVGATGAASALPANPLGYLVAHVGTTEVRIPYYNA